MRAQTEIMGLAIIVFILVIAGTFMIISNSRPIELVSSDKDIADSFLYTLMHTQTRISLSVSDIIKGCFENLDRCGNDCCTYGESTLKNALKVTLDDWEKDYRLQVYQDSNVKILITNNPECDDDAPKDEPGYYYIPSDEWIIARLDICK